ncbi:nucleotidyltransferase domain-containing protein [Nitrospirillum sp. BR 11163]|uniref:nucleotidyltransferase domain-containing protein n=1 Tax=Nitrospirillum sp. BR 11163 TaxID=3104323 RepID=UPI002AFF1D02|nr:nucleotidyltransferase domain-containing protein [Nitrospirillum sp. BR 11163]MEA1675996.1 nucleotidyltransferase domain-containing protein [Nitrospirillum sp. BR 11163]
MTDFSDPFVDPAIHTRIQAELGAVEQEEGVRILLAIESGSRGWRFPSQDSDYDVRFLYLRPLSSYLTVTDQRDVIERPVDAVFDVSGWDLRKAFQLALRSNAVLIEWLCSPVRYRELGPAAARLLNFARASVDLTAVAYHYDRQARRMFNDVLAAEAPRLKTYCYALRSALALQWVRERRDVPPMDLPALLRGLFLSAEVADEIAALVARKLPSTERDTTARLPILDHLIGNVLAQPVPAMRGEARREVGRRADALFAELVLDAYAN